MSMSQTSAAGKTAPKLFSDFLVFDPLRSGAQSNFLTDLPPPVGEGQQLGPQIGSCRHEYTTKLLQSVLPPADTRPNQHDIYQVAVICRKCRIHADIRISYRSASEPCPNATFPLHHFIREPLTDVRSNKRLQYGWKCSAQDCNAQLAVAFRPPRLSDEERNLLTNTENLKRRYEAVVQDDPAREGTRQATPMDALSRLRRYIKDSLNTEHTKRTFPANNKRFMEAYGVHGEDCADLLSNLGFKYADSHWTLPNPTPIQDRIATDFSSARELLEDVEMELLASMNKLSSDMGVINPAASEGWPSAERNIERVLAAQGYERLPSTWRAATANEDLPYLSSLGALPDFADLLIAFAFDRQVACNPALQSYYFECLQVISDSRGTEQLQMKVATLASQDLISRRDLAAAHRFLSLPPPTAESIDDEQILDIFHVRQSDSGLQAQEEARQALYKIGMARGSQRLINASRQTIETYEEALSWLGNGVTKDTPDDSLLVVAAMKTSDNSNATEMVQKAISVIAKERQSDQLNSWLLTGRSDGYQMTTEEALRYLGIDQSLTDIDSTVLPILYENARNDRPGDQTEKAITTIQKAIANTVDQTSHAPENWPVGLTSHGNTCYLNSLLQYYFSIKPLRDIILDYEKYELDPSRHSEKLERVGQRKISMVEIKGGQKFAHDLKHLFERMIKDPGTCIKPEEDLVCRAFLEPKDYALLVSESKREPMSTTTQESKANNDDLRMTNGPEELTKTCKESPTVSGDSSPTLQGSAVDDDIDSRMKPADLPLTPPASPKADPTDTLDRAPAPPLPPRRFSTTKEEALEKAELNARQQQDVTEVHDGIMFRLRSGMMPKGKDESEEQNDDLRQLFSIALTETPVKDGVEGKRKALTDTSIQLDVPVETTDLYSALDAVFDLQIFDESKGLETYKSIRQAPPVLQINIPRIGFDQHGRGGAFKSESCVKLPEELFLDRYTDDVNPEVLPKRKACWGWRRQLHVLRKEQKALRATMADLDAPSALLETAKYLEKLAATNDDLASVDVPGLDLDAQLPSQLRADAEKQDQRVAQLDSEIQGLESQLQNQFDHMKQLRYRLAAVFFHRGSYGHGHYWIYICDFGEEGAGTWRLYNDERVEAFTKTEEIFQAKTWNHGTPTYAVYVLDESKKDIVQPVCRDIEKLTAEPELMEIEADNRQERRDSAATLEGDVPMSNAESQNLG